MTVICHIMKKWCNQAFSTRSQFPWLQWNSSICWEMKNGIEDCSFMIKGHVPGNPATTIQAYKAYKHVNICIYVTYVCMYFAWMSVCTYVTTFSCHVWTLHWPQIDVYTSLQAPKKHDDQTMTTATMTRWGWYVWWWWWGWRFMLMLFHFPIYTMRMRPYIAIVYTC